MSTLLQARTLAKKSRWAKGEISINRRQQFERILSIIKLMSERKYGVTHAIIMAYLNDLSLGVSMKTIQRDMDLLLTLGVADRKGSQPMRYRFVGGPFWESIGKCDRCEAEL